MKYHYNSDNGKVYLCRASKKPCPLGADTLHENFKNAIEAQHWADQLNAEKFGKDFNKVTKNSEGTKKSKLQLTKRYLPMEEREELPFYQNQIVSGLLRYSDLNEDSYREFGFLPMDEKGIQQRNRLEGPSEEYLMERMMLKDSEEKLKNLSTLQTRAFNFYGSTGFEAINRLIYNPKEFHQYYGNDPEPLKLENFEESNMFIVPYQKINEALTSKLIGEMDRAIASAPKQQKIVYRGVTPQTVTKDISKDKPSVLPDDLEGMKDYSRKWVEENRSLGTEIVMEGFSSTTATFRTAQHFSDDGGIIYEMLTSEGANISAHTEYLEEREVLMPRKQRYVVVGVHKDVEMFTDEGPQTFHIIQLVGINSKGEILDGSNSEAIESFIEETE